MALYVVIKQNKIVPKGTYLLRDEDGFMRCKMKLVNGGVQAGETQGLVIPATQELINSIAEVRPGRGLDPDLLRKLIQN